MNKGERLSPELEAAIEKAESEIREVLEDGGCPFNVLRAFAREIQEPMEHEILLTEWALEIVSGHVNPDLERELLASQKSALTLAEALEKLRKDEWRCTVDWGPRDDRDAINAECDAALAAYRKKGPPHPGGHDGPDGPLKSQTQSMVIAAIRQAVLDGIQACHCKSANCQRCNPLHRAVDGLSALESGIPWPLDAYRASESGRGKP